LPPAEVGAGNSLKDRPIGVPANVSSFLDADEFVFVPMLEARFPAILDELRALPAAAFVPSPDSLTTVAGDYDETGWRWCALFDTRPSAASAAANRARCPRTARAIAAVPGVVNAGFSLFQPGTRLYPHRGELRSVLRCHLPLVVPAGDVALRCGASIRRWQPGRCLVFDDTLEHEAWNRSAADRVVLIVTFQVPVGEAAAPN
jgi:beta-hydroxylase